MLKKQLVVAWLVLSIFVNQVFAGNVTSRQNLARDERDHNVLEMNVLEISNQTASDNVVIDVESPPVAPNNEIVNRFSNDQEIDLSDINVSEARRNELANPHSATSSSMEGSSGVNVGNSAIPYDCDDVFYPENRVHHQGIFSVDPAFVGSILNMKEVVWPITARKAMFWCGYAALGVGLAELDRNFGIFQTVATAVQDNAEAILISLYAMEPLFNLIDLTMAKYPEAAELPNPEAPVEGVSEVALVIPAHNSSSSIKKTLIAALKHLKPNQIFVVDNGNSEHPTDDTHEQIKSVDPRINYIWQGIPNKTVALYAGSMAANKLGFKYIMTTDDDVRLPENFDFCTREINDDVKAVCFPVRAVSESGKASILVDWQDIEYQAADLGKMLEARFCGVQFPHGAGSLWEIQTFLDSLKNHHDTIFYADDVKLGIALAEKGKSMAMCSTVILDTDAPSSILGKKPNYWNQRVRSWEMIRHAIFGTSLKLLISPFSKVKYESKFGTLIKKKSQLTLVVADVADWLKLPATLIIANDPYVWAKIGVFNTLSIVAPLLLNYAGPLDNRPELKVKLGAILTYPVYKLIYAGVCAAGALRAVFIYLPNVETVPTIKELDEDRDRRCVWLRNDSGIKK